MLLLTSVADRTSPVQRGKWVLQVLLGAPPPPPPPNVPALEDTKAAAEGRLLSVRERMEQHRANPACMSCHRVIDPIGLALENFDVDRPLPHQGQRRAGGLDRVSSTTARRWKAPPVCAARCIKHKDAFLMTFAENLMTYALGRRVEAYDMPALRAIVRDAAKQNDRDRRVSSPGITRSARVSDEPPRAGQRRSRRQTKDDR